MSAVRTRSDARSVRPTGSQSSEGVEEIFAVCEVAGRVLLPSWVMTTPRQVVPGRFAMLTRRCTQRMFLLRPDAEANNAILYCMIEAAVRFRMEIVVFAVMSNHHHIVLFDRHYIVFHKMVAKCLNVLRGRWENLWSSEPPCITHLVDPQDVIDKAIYAASNPVKDGLVERVHQWPGLDGLAALMSGKILTARRPHFFFAENGTMPEAVSMALTIPPELGIADLVKLGVRAGVTAVELECARRRAETGKRVVGRRTILRQSWRDSPRSVEPRRHLRPRIAARDLVSRLEAIDELRRFARQYKAARQSWIAGAPTPFPKGTYWMHRVLGVPIAT